jgi:hypothetical protein
LEINSNQNQNQIKSNQNFNSNSKPTKIMENLMVSLALAYILIQLSDGIIYFIFELSERFARHIAGPDSDIRILTINLFFANLTLVCMLLFAYNTGLKVNETFLNCTSLNSCIEDIVPPEYHEYFL